MKGLYRTLAFAATAATALLSSCVHEYPESPAADPTEIKVNITLDTEPAITRGSVLAGTKSEESPCMYFIVEIYRDRLEGEPVVRREFGAHRTDDGSSSVQFTETLHAGNYKAVAFAVCTKDISGTGCVYNTGDLSRITFSDTEYRGSTDLKECYDARFDIDLSGDKWYQTVDIRHTLTCPMGRLEIVSEDAEEFLTKVQASTAGQAGTPPSLDSEDYWQEYYVRWDYVLYFPVGYNVFTGLPNKAETQISFSSDITPLSDDEVLLGYDYVFVNGDETSVSVTLTLFNRDKEKLNTYSNLPATLYKGETTVIRGDYLTQNRGSGIGIDPGFDGDIEITLPD